MKSNTEQVDTLSNVTFKTTILVFQFLTLQEKNKSIEVLRENFGQSWFLVYEDERIYNPRKHEVFMLMFLFFKKKSS